MKIELPENPYIYLNWFGILLIVLVFSIIVIEGKKDLIDFLILLFAVILLVFGWKGLKKQQDLKNEKIRRETELLKAKTEESEALAGRHRGHTFG